MSEYLKLARAKTQLLSFDQKYNKGLWRNPGWLDIRDYGAKGNGKADDTSAFQSAFNAITTSDGILVIPAGTYKITSTLTVPATALLRILGSGGTLSTLLWNGGNNIPVIQVNSSNSLNTQDFEISHLGITNSNSSTGLIGIQFNSLGGNSNRNAIIIKNVVTQNTAVGIKLYGGIEEVIFQQCDFSGGTIGIQYVGSAAQNFQFWNNNFRELTSWAVDLQSISGASFRGNISQSDSATAGGFRLDKLTGIDITANSFGFLHSPNAAVYLGVSAVGSSSFSGANVTANQITSGTGILVDYVNAVTIMNNGFYAGPCIHLTTHASNILIGPQNFTPGATPTLTNDGATNVTILDASMGYSVPGGNLP